jgi:hypothetical protein
MTQTTYSNTKPQTGMRNILLIIILILLGLLIWCWMCCQAMKKELADCKRADSTCSYKLEKCMAGGDCPLCCQPLDNTVPFKLDNNDVIAMVGKYAQDHWEAINGTTAMTPCVKDSRSIWVSISRMKAFIKDIEDKTNLLFQSGPKCCDTLGIRIYLAEYPEPALVSRFGLPDNYVNKTTVVMIPTIRWQSDRIDHDFNPLYYINTPKQYFCGQTDTLEWTVGLEAMTMNHGCLIPPPFPSSFSTPTTVGNYTFPAYLNSGAEFMLSAVDPKINPSNNKIYNRYFYWKQTDMDANGCKPLPDTWND